MNMVGRLTVFCGPMFAGKTEALIKRASKLPGRCVYKPTTDTRNGGSSILSHGGAAIFAEYVDPKLEQLLPYQGSHLVAPAILIDEAQFLHEEAIGRILVMTRQGIDVVLAGLDLTAKGGPFGCMPQFLCLADEVVKLSGACSQCGASSSRTRCKVRQETTVLVGGAEAYEPLCRTCYEGSWAVQEGAAGYFSPILCDHANEMPSGYCRCNARCSCRSGMCPLQPVQATP